MKRLLTLTALVGLSLPAMAADDASDPIASDDASRVELGAPTDLQQALAHRRPPPRRPAQARGRPAPGPRSAPARPAARPGNAPRAVHGPPPRVVRHAPPPRVVRHSPPPRVVVRQAPARRVYVHAPPPPVLRHRTVIVRRAHPWHGVFVYGPRPVYHRQYDAPAPQEVEEQHLPDRKVDRRNSVAVGVRSGSYLSAYDGGSSYGDLGLGLVGRWRPDEAVGLELAVTHHDETWNAATERSQTVGQGSVMLFANPWGRVQPYVLGGLSANGRQLDDAVRTSQGAMRVQARDTLWGPHAGAGIEFAFGQRAALDLEARYVGWMNDTEASLPGAFQTSASFMLHF